MWEGNKDREKPLSKLANSKQTGIQYTTICEQLVGRRGGEKCGKIASGFRIKDSVAKNRGRRAAATVTYQEEEEDKEERGKKFKWVALLML